MPPILGVVLFTAQGVFDATNGVLDGAFGLIGLAFGIQSGVADDFSDGFFDFAFYDFCRSGDPIFIHGSPL